MSDTFVVPYAWMSMDDGSVRMVRPEFAKRGPEYRCPECDAALSLRKPSVDGSGEVTRRKRFAHVADSPCTGGTGEGRRHKLAKQLVAQAMRDWMSGVTSAPVLHMECRACGHAQYVPMNSVDEVDVDRSLLGHVADVFVRQGAKECAIEILDTHAMEPEKTAAFDALAWWIEVDAGRVLDGELRVRRASWTLRCPSPRCTGTLSESDLASMRARRAFAELPIEQRLADVCPGCGQHVLSDEAARLDLVKAGGVVNCKNCQLDKVVEPFA